MANVSLSLMITLALCVGGCATTRAKAPVAGNPAVVAPANSEQAAWKLLDTNGDGFLDRDEIEGQHAVALLRDLHRADLNRDGMVSMAEWHGWWPTMEHQEPADSLQQLNRSSAPLNGVRGN